MDFDVTFQLTLYLDHFSAISISSQGSFYIAVSLCPKNSIIGNPTYPCENSLGKVHLTHNFYVKYTSNSAIIQTTLSRSDSASPSLSLYDKILTKILLPIKRTRPIRPSTTHWSSPSSWWRKFMKMLCWTRTSPRCFKITLGWEFIRFNSGLYLSSRLSSFSMCALIFHMLLTWVGPHSAWLSPSFQRWKSLRRVLPFA